MNDICEVIVAMLRASSVAMMLSKRVVRRPRRDRAILIVCDQSEDPISICKCILKRMQYGCSADLDGVCSEGRRAAVEDDWRDFATERDSMDLDGHVLVP